MNNVTSSARLLALTVTVLGTIGVGHAASASAQFRVGPTVGYNSGWGAPTAGLSSTIGISNLSDRLQLHGVVTGQRFFAQQDIEVTDPNLENYSYYRVTAGLQLLYTYFAQVRPYANLSAAKSYAEWTTTNSYGEYGEGYSAVTGELALGALLQPDSDLQPFVELRTHIARGTEHDYIDHTFVLGVYYQF